uniref:F-box domain-containing protein n=1 Tax=Mola mola TaxID=94237 RepID=A0A3Q3W189_MOLML
MKLRVRVQRHTSRLELLGEEPSLKELIDSIKDTVLPSVGLSMETEFSVSLNSSELLSDTGQTLSSCGIVSGDLICVILPESAAARTTDSTNKSRNSSDSPNSSSEKQTKDHNQQTRSDEKCDGRVKQSHTVTCHWEPMLCSEAEEGQVPLSLELLYHSAQTSSPNDAVMVAANLLMIETGFIPVGLLTKTTQMPSEWRSAGGAYKLQYTHPLCGDSMVMLVAVSMGPTLVINAMLKVNQSADTIHKLCVNPASYVTNEWPGESAAAAFRDLSKLSRVFKDQLAYPLIAAAREAMALPVAFGLAALPPELLLRVLRLLDVSSLVRLSMVCRLFHASTADSSLWRHLYRRDFADSDTSRTRDTDWKELYKQRYKIRSELRHSHRRCIPPFPQPPRDIFNPLPFFPPLPGIIGGEYDQRPNLPHGLFPRPRYDPIGPFPDPDRRLPVDLSRAQQRRGRAADVRRGFI